MAMAVSMCHAASVCFQVEKLQRDSDQYTSYAMASFSAAVEAAVPVLLQKVCLQHPASLCD